MTNSSEPLRPDQAADANESGVSEASSRSSGADDRRDFLATSASLLAMSGGLAAGYGAFGLICLRFLFPSGEKTKGWQYVATVDQLKMGEAIAYVAPSGAKIVVARQGAGETAENFIALSSVCPHLGCQVRWEAQNDRFFCPCHNGAFDPRGNPTDGPPLSANQSLLRFPLRVDDGVLFIEAPLQSVTRADQTARADGQGARHSESMPESSEEEMV